MTEAKTIAVPAKKQSKNIITMFVVGARQGWNIAVNSMIPNVMFAFALIKILKLTGLLDILSHVFAPVMALFGLPGAAIMVNVAALMSMGGAMGVCASLFSSGVLNAHDITVLLPAVFVCGGQMQNLGRILGTSEVTPRFYPLLLGMTVVNAVIAMVAMNIILKMLY